MTLNLVLGLVTVAVQVNYTNVATGYTVQLVGQVSGRVSASRWEFDDGSVLSNRPYASRAWAVPGDYPIVLRAFNDSYPTGVTATVIIHVINPLYYVSRASINPVSPYLSWATAATNIQDAIDATYPGGGTVLVSNGVYAIGGRVISSPTTNRVAVTRAMSVQSLNGPAVTVIDGGGASRCVYLTNGAVLSGFTLTNGFALDDGGGVWCVSSNIVVSNCVLAGNSAVNSGGGAFQATLNNCTLSANSAHNGGGASSCALSNCTLSVNAATADGGAANSSSLRNCILRNTASVSGGGVISSILDNCTLANNSAVVGGGADSSMLTFCALLGNSASGHSGVRGGGANSSTLNNCTLLGNSTPSGSGGGAAYSTLKHSGGCLSY